MRKSLPKTSHSGPSSRVAPLSPALLAVAGEPERPRRAVKPNGSAARSHAAEDARVVQLASRMRLLEGFLSRTEVADAAQHALQWLGDVLGVRQSLCLIKPSAEASLFTIAACGFKGNAASSFAISLEEWTNPL